MDHSKLRQLLRPAANLPPTRFLPIHQALALELVLVLVPALALALALASGWGSELVMETEKEECYLPVPHRGR